MKKNFKIGDRVRIIKDSDIGSSYSWYIGKVFTVVKLYLSCDRIEINCPSNLSPYPNTAWRIEDLVPYKRQLEFAFMEDK